MFIDNKMVNQSWNFTMLPEHNYVKNDCSKLYIQLFLQLEIIMKPFRSSARSQVWQKRNPAKTRKLLLELDGFEVHEDLWSLYIAPWTG